MVEVLRKKTTAEVLAGLDPEGKRPLLVKIQTLRACHPDDLEALYRRPPVEEVIILQPVLTTA